MKQVVCITKMKCEVKSTRSILLTVLLLTTIILALKTPLVQSSSEAYDSVVIYKDLTQLSTGHEEEAPSIALDHNGNLHTVWIGNETLNLYYMMVNRYGNTLINETCLDPHLNYTGRRVRRASIGVDSNNNVHIVFHSKYVLESWPDYTNYTELDAREVFYLKINPYLDDMDGSAADYVDITVMPETIISTNDGNKSRAANLAVDSEDNVHVAWFDGYTWGNEGELHYLVMDGTGGIVVPETNVTAGFYTYMEWSEPEIVVDSQGNAHVFFVTEGWTGSTWNWRDIYYTMIDGSTGNVLINNTQLTNSSQTWKHSRPFVDIDSEDKIHVAWHDSRFDDAGTGEHEIFYMKIDPYLDDRNGDTADPETITIVDEMLVSENDDVRSFLANIYVDEHDMAHIVWINRYTGWPTYEGGIYYALVNATGDIIIPESRITNASGTLDFTQWYYSGNRNPEIAVTDGRIFIVDMAADINTWDYDVWLTIAFVDKIPPSTSISYTAYSSEGKDWLSEESPISLSTHDEESGVSATYYKIDGNPWQIYVQPFTLSGLPDGSHTIKYYSVDNFGNEEEVKEQKVYSDSTSPIIYTPTRDPSGDVEEGQPVDISVDIEDSGSGVNDDKVILSYTLDDGATWATTKMTYSSTLGLYEATVPRQFNCTWVKYMISASDNVGNTAVQDNGGLYYSYHTIAYDVTEDPLYQELLGLRDKVDSLSQQNDDLTDKVDALSEQNANQTDKADSLTQQLNTMTLQLLGTGIITIVLVIVTIAVIYLSKRRPAST